MKTVLAPVDFSPVSQSVITEAVALARKLEARLVLLHVVRPVPLLPSTFGIPQTGAEVPVSISQTAGERLRQLQRQLLQESITAHTVHVIGDPAVEIAAQAERLGAHLIVMGSHGHSAVYDLLIGSTAQQVLKLAPCPVVLLPPRAELLAATAREATSVAAGVPPAEKRNSF